MPNFSALKLKGVGKCFLVRAHEGRQLLVQVSAKPRPSRGRANDIYLDEHFSVFRVHDLWESTHLGQCNPSRVCFGSGGGKWSRQRLNAAVEARVSVVLSCVLTVSKRGPIYEETVDKSLQPISGILLAGRSYRGGRANEQF